MIAVEFMDVQETHLDQILGWRNSDGIRKFMYQESLITPDEHRAWFESLRGDRRRKYWVMCVGDKPAGLVNLVSIDRRNLTCEWAFYIGEAWAQKLGLGRIAEFHTLDYVFFFLNLEKLNCAVLDFNKAVVNMHKGFGFQVEGQVRSQILKAEGRRDVVLLGLTRSEWLQSRDRVYEDKIKPVGEYSFRYSDGFVVKVPEN